VDKVTPLGPSVNGTLTAQKCPNRGCSSGEGGEEWCAGPEDLKAQGPGVRGNLAGCVGVCGQSDTTWAARTWALTAQNKPKSGVTKVWGRSGVVTGTCTRKLEGTVPAGAWYLRYVWECVDKVTRPGPRVHGSLTAQNKPKSGVTKVWGRSGVVTWTFKLEVTVPAGAGTPGGMFGSVLAKLNGLERAYVSSCRLKSPISGVIKLWGWCGVVT
jgi:hypothetical protein